MPIPVKQTVILAKIESSYGVDPTPVPATDALLVSDVSISPTGEKIDRDILTQSLSPHSPRIGTKEVELTFSTELKGSGTNDVPPPIGPMLRACGMAETINVGTDVQYDPASLNLESVTFYVYFQNIIHKLHGAVGTFELVMAAGQIAMINWTFRGLYLRPADSTLPASPTYSVIIPPIACNANFTIGGYAAITQQVQVSLNNDIGRRDNVNAVGCVEGFLITKRNSAGSMNPEAVLEATNAFWQDWELSNPQALSIQIGAVAGNTCTITADKAVYDSIAWGDREALRIYDIPMTLARTSGDDELNLKFE